MTSGICPENCSRGKEKRPVQLSRDETARGLGHGKLAAQPRPLGLCVRPKGFMTRLCSHEGRWHGPAACDGSPSPGLETRVPVRSQAARPPGNGALPARRGAAPRSPRPKNCLLRPQRPTLCLLTSPRLGRETASSSRETQVEMRAKPRVCPLGPPHNWGQWRHPHRGA